MLFRKCLCNEQIEVLLYAAEKGAFISGLGREEFETLCSLVETGHMYRGDALTDYPESAYYSITQKGHSALVCNSIKDLYDKTSLYPHLAAHIKTSRLDCSQVCMPEKISPEEDSTPTQDAEVFSRSRSLSDPLTLRDKSSR